jgi:hypothetical protein
VTSLHIWLQAQLHYHMAAAAAAVGLLLQSLPSMPVHQRPATPT